MATESDVPDNRVVDSAAGGDEEVLVSDGSEEVDWPPPLWRRLYGQTNKISIEPAVFGVTFVYGLQAVIANNLLIERACLRNLNFSESICSNLSAHKSEQEQVQTIVTTMVMYSSILSSLPGIILCLFIGPWSDTNGRKPLMMLPIIGFGMTHIILIGITFFSSAHAEWYLLTSIYGVFGGGVACFGTGAFSYMTDITSEKSRTARIAMVDVALFFGFPAGTILSSPLYRIFGFYGVFGTCLCLSAVNLFLLGLLVKESRGPRAHLRYAHLACDDEASDLGSQRRSRRLFSFSHLKSVFDSSFKWRPNQMRTVLLMLIWAMLLNQTLYMSGTITYLYTRLKFDWTEKEYTIFSSISTLMATLSTMTFLPLLSLKAKLKDTTIGMMGCVSGLVGNLVLAFAAKWWMLIISLACGILGPSASAIVRSMTSKVGDKSEIGKIFSLVSSLESVVPLIVMPGLTLLYNKTINFFPGSVYVVIAAIFFFNIINFFVVSRILKKYEGQTYGDLREEEEEAEQEEGQRYDQVPIVTRQNNGE